MPNPFSQSRRRKAENWRTLQRGFTLVELIIVISISALLAVYAQAKIARDAEEQLARGSGQYLLSVANAAQTHVLLNFNEYANALPVTGVAIPLRPTIAEIIALGRLNPGFPAGAGALPTRQTARIDVLPTGCPGVACNLQILVCTTTPVTLGAADVRFDLASEMVTVQNGAGGQSLYGQGAQIRGPAINVANPLGNVEGIVCSTSSVDTALFQRFVTIGDTRDPNLAGNLTVAGNGRIEGTTKLVGAVTMDSTLTTTGATTLNGPTNVNNNLLVNGTATVNGATTLNSTLAVASNATVTGQVSADQLVPVGVYALGTACANAGGITRQPGGAGLAVCQSGVWTPLSTGAVAGGACANDGATATTATGVGLLCLNGTYHGLDTLMRYGSVGSACGLAGVTAVDLANNNETLICKANLSDGSGTLRLMRLRDLLSQLTFVSAVEVSHGDLVNKPVCQASGSHTPTPIIQLIPKTYASSDGGFAVYATDLGASWRVYMMQGDNVTPMDTVTSRSIAQVFCYFP